jgi:acyl-CoA thioesterase FadM
VTRTVSFETPTDPTLFGPDQPHPRALLALSMRGFATWLAEHLVPYSRLVYDFGTGAVFTTVRLDYLGELRFTDADWLTTTTLVQVSESATDLRLDVDVDARCALDGRRLPVAHSHADLRLVTIFQVELPEEIRRFAVSSPTRSITAVFHRPLYLFDDYRLTTRMVAEGAPGLPALVYEMDDLAHAASCVTAWATLSPNR